MVKVLIPFLMLNRPLKIVLFRVCFKIKSLIFTCVIQYQKWYNRSVSLLFLTHLPPFVQR